MHAQLGLAVEQRLRRVAALPQHRLRLHGLGDPEPFEHGGEVDAAGGADGRIVVDDRARLEERALERVHCGDVPLRGTLPDGDTDRRLRDVGSRAGDCVIRLRQRVHHRVGRDEDVGLLAALDLALQAAAGVGGDRDRVPGLLLESLAELGHHGLHGARAEHANLGAGGGGHAEHARGQQRDGERERAHAGYIEKSVAFSVMNSSRAGVPSRVLAMARLMAGTMSSGAVTRSPQPPNAFAMSA